MLETSADLLRIVIALAVLWLAIFTSWAIYYVAMILRNANQLMKNVNDKLSLVDKILKLVHEKLEHSASHLGMIADSAFKLVSYMIERNMTGSTDGRRSAKGKRKK